MSMDALYSELEHARQTWVGIHNLLRDGKYDLAGPRAILDGRSISAFHQQVLVVFEGIFAIRPDDIASAQAAFVAGKAPEIRASLSAFQSYGQSTLSTLTQYWQEGTTFRDANDNLSFQIFQNESHVTNFDGAGNFTYLQSSLNQLTSHLASLLPFCRPSAIADLADRAKILGDLARDAENLRGQVAQKAADARRSAESAANNENATLNALAAAESTLAKLNADQQQATQDAATVTALVQQIKAVATNADSLEAQVTEYQGRFDAFQKQLDDRNARFSKFEKDTELADQENTKREEAIDRITKQADAMISGSTTAGLAKSLEDTRLRYEERMNGAKTGFKWSVGLLIVSALPLAAQLLPGLFGSWIPAINPMLEGSPYAVLGKVVLLLPCTWLTAFFTKSYAEFFHLEREYAHKAALAMSVDGFKRQAPKYEEEITAEVFLEIRNNPANGKSPDPASHPLYDVLSKVVSRVINRSEKPT